ncbi:hypothetical protein H9P43_008649 [Blastocladiella emersonii ATCC 22665]|nr:hypothetical protein H9P43_008649 [Blastocladiella emersonii ATCC 22665]
MEQPATSGNVSSESTVVESPDAAIPALLTCRTPYRGARASSFRPYRNKPPRDLFLYHDSTSLPELKALVCACGDLAEVARTVCEAAAKGATATLSFTLNDWQPEILARNLLILHAPAFTPPNDLDTDALARYVGQLWYSVVLDPDVRDFWDGQLRACVDLDWLGFSADSSLRVLNESTLCVDLINLLFPPAPGVKRTNANRMRLLNTVVSPKAIASIAVEFTRLIFDAFAAGHQAVMHSGMDRAPTLLIFFDRPVLLTSAGPGMIPTPALECTVAVIDDAMNPSPEAEYARRSRIFVDCAKAIAGRLSVFTLPPESTVAFSMFKFMYLADPVPEADPRFSADLYVRLRPLLRRVLVLPAYPVCSTGMDKLGRQLKTFLDKGI